MSYSISMINTPPILPDDFSLPIATNGRWKDAQSEVSQILTTSSLESFLQSLPFKEFRQLFQDTNHDPSVRKEKCIRELSEICKVYQEFEKIMLAREDISRLFVHDVRSIAGNLPSILGVVQELENLLWDVATLTINSYIPMAQRSCDLLLNFFESLYFVWDVSEKFIQTQTKKFSLAHAIDMAIFASETRIGVGSDIKVIWLESLSGISVEGIEGDVTILLMNILKNARKHGKADTIVFQWEKRAHEKVFTISDNGMGIREDIIWEILKEGFSGGESTGLWLRNLEKRWLNVQISNEWLPSKYSEGSNTKKWAKFEITFP